MRVFIFFAALFFAQSSFAQAPQLVIPRGHNTDITVLTISPDKKLLATGDNQGNIKLWDMETGKEVRSFDNPKVSMLDDIRGLAFSSDSKKLYSGLSYDLHIYDLANSGKEIFNKKIHEDRITGLLVSANGKTLVTAADNVVKIWDADNLASPKVIAIKGKKPKLAFDDAGNIIAVTTGNYIEVTASFDFKDIITNIGYITRINTATGQIITTDEFENLDKDDFYISPNGKLLAITRYENVTENNEEFSAGTIQLLNIESKKIIKKFTGIRDSSIYTMAFNKNNRYMVTKAGTTFILYDLESMQPVKTFTSDDNIFTSSVLFSADDSKLYQGYNSNGSVLELNLKKITVEKVFGSNANYVKNLAITPNGKSLVMLYGTSDYHSKNLYLQKFDFNSTALSNIESKGDIEPKAEFDIAAAAGKDVTPDGKFIFKGNFDKSVSISELRKNTAVATMVFFGEKDWVVVDKAGRFDGTQQAMKQMYYVKGLDILPLESGYEQFYTPRLLARILEGEDFKPIAVNINTIKDAPKVKITAEQIQRNLTVEDDVAVFKSENEQVNIKVQADCPNDGVTEIRLFQNGKLVQTTRNLVVEDEKASEKSSTKTFAVTLQPGENRFKAIAFNTERTESKPAELIVNFKELKIDVPVASAATLHLIVVGVNSYKNPKYNLNYALADATSFSEAIVSGSKDLFAKTNTIFIKDADATKEGMTAAFEKVKAAAKPQDLFIFYYAGHGVINDKNKFFLVPYDVTQLYGNDGALEQKGFSAVELQQMSKDIKAQKQLFILDACQSAGALNSVVSARGAAEEKAISQLARATGTYWLTASSSEQFASEFSQLGHGSFTYCLLQAFKGDANPGDNKLTVKILDAYLQTKVPEITQKYKGTVQYPVSYSYGNDFPIIMVK